MVVMLWNELYFGFYVAFFILLLSYICWIIWHAREVPETELLYNRASILVPKIVSKCSGLNDKYIPTYLWGKNGHIQSLLHTIVGRFGSNADHPSKRYQLIAKDGSVLSYDISEPIADPIDNDYLLLIVPGICNHAENNYIKAFTYHMATNGFRIAVFNHTGALKTVELMRPRIFTYGETSDLETVIERILETEKVKKLIALGFSLGGNILLKYLGEKPERQKHFLFAASVCAGYDVPECNAFFQEKDCLRWLYNYALTRNMLKVINHHKKKLSTLCLSREPPLNLNWKKILSSRALHELDEEFTLKIFNESKLHTFYETMSSRNFFDSIKIPLLLVNARDDPLIPAEHYRHPKNLINTNENALFVVPPFGGHLGFFEGGYLIPNRVSWMDRMLGEFFVTAIDVITKDGTSA